MNKKTFIVVVDDDAEKINSLLSSLHKKKIEYYQLSALNPAMKFIEKESSRIDGIILDMGLPRFEKGTIDPYAGIELLEELKRLNINIPTLINSSTPIDKEKYPFVFWDSIILPARDTEIVLKEFLESIEKEQ